MTAKGCKRKILYREYDNKGNLIKLECSNCGEIKTVDCFNKINHLKTDITMHVKVV